MKFTSVRPANPAPAGLIQPQSQPEKFLIRNRWFVRGYAEPGPRRPNSEPPEKTLLGSKIAITIATLRRPKAD